MTNEDGNEIFTNDENRIAINVDVSTSPMKIKRRNASTNTNIISSQKKDYFFESISDNDLHFYTGFNRQRFLFLFTHLNIKETEFNVYIPVHDQLIVTLIKLRMNMYYGAIGRYYGISRFAVKKIFVFWLSQLYFEFKKIDWWSLGHKCEKCYTVLLDCTEVFCEHSAQDPEFNQQLFSSYKNHYTIKFVVGMCEKGTVTFVSKAFGGSVSDRQIVEKSGLLDLLKDGDIVCADKGFTISDLLENHGVAVNLPPRLGKRRQLTAHEIKTTNNIARRRVHIERIIGFIKDNKILKDTFKQSLMKYVNAIVYVCAMLSNFKSPIVN